MGTGNRLRGSASHAYKHGQSYSGDYRRPKRTSLYRAWVNMRNRCRNPRNPNYPYYGGRGIEILPAWDDFAVFCADVGPHPGAGLTLDRIDNNGHYKPGNVRWATRAQQSRNRNYCRLSEAAAREIRAARAEGELIKFIAQRFAVSQRNIEQGLSEGTWRDV
jgi:hypothetical protein